MFGGWGIVKTNSSVIVSCHKVAIVFSRHGYRSPAFAVGFPWLGVSRDVSWPSRRPQSIAEPAPNNSGVRRYCGSRETRPAWTTVLLSSCGETPCVRSISSPMRPSIFFFLAYYYFGARSRSFISQGWICPVNIDIDEAREAGGRLGEWPVSRGPRRRQEARRGRRYGGRLAPAAASSSSRRPAEGHKLIKGL